jgi:type IV secretory pathway protease TraF
MNVFNVTRYFCTLNLKDAAYLLLQDNRNHSDDSRDYGPVEKSRILGKLTWAFNLPE